MIDIGGIAPQTGPDGPQMIWARAPKHGVSPCAMRLQVRDADGTHVDVEQFEQLHLLLSGGDAAGFEMPAQILDAEYNSAEYKSKALHAPNPDIGDAPEQDDADLLYSEVRIDADSLAVKGNIRVPDGTQSPVMNKSEPSGVLTAFDQIAEQAAVLGGTPSQSVDTATKEVVRLAPSAPVRAQGAAQTHGGEQAVLRADSQMSVKVSQIPMQEATIGVSAAKVGSDRIQTMLVAIERDQSVNGTVAPLRSPVRAAAISGAITVSSVSPDALIKEAPFGRLGAPKFSAMWMAGDDAMKNTVHVKAADMPFQNTENAGPRLRAKAKSAAFGLPASPINERPLAAALMSATLTTSTATALPSFEPMSPSAPIGQAGGFLQTTHLSTLQTPSGQENQMGRIAWQQTAAKLAQPMHGHIEVELNPAELGRLNIRIESTEGQARVILQAERPETLEAMRRTYDQFGQDLRDLGFKSLEFQFRSGKEGAMNPAPQDTPPKGRDTPCGEEGQDTPGKSLFAAQPTPKDTIIVRI